MTGNRPDERLKKWYFIQIAGGGAAVFGILATTYAIATAMETKGPIRPFWQIGLIVLGLAVHFAGRAGARRLR